MREYLNFYIDGKWVDPLRPNASDVENPATEQVSGKISLGSAADVDVAVKGRPTCLRQAGRKAVAKGGSTCWQAIPRGVPEAVRATSADAVSEEMGAPASLAAGPQVNLGIGHLATAIEVLKNFQFEEQHGATLIASRSRSASVRADHAVELAAQPGRGQGVSRAGDGLHNGAETV